MGFVKQCDVCGEVFDSPTPNAHELTIQYGTGLYFQGFVCEKCIKRFDSLFQKQFLAQNTANSDENSANSDNKKEVKENGRN